jgi:hypothetical protein
VDLLRRRQAAAGGRLNRIWEAIVMDQPKIGEELKKIPVEPLLPVEKKLIGWSLSIGVVLLVLLALLNRYLF